MAKNFFPLLVFIVEVSIVFPQSLPFELKFEGDSQCFYAPDLPELFGIIRQHDLNGRSCTILIRGNALDDATKEPESHHFDSSRLSKPIMSDETGTFTIMGDSDDFSKMPVIDGQNNAAILWRFSEYKNLVIKNLHFKCFKKAGIQLGRCERCRIVNCMFSDVTVSDGCAGIYLDNCNNCIVDSCVFEGLADPSGSPAFHAVYLDNLSKFNLIQNNVIKECSGSAFKVRNGSDENEFLFNIIEKCVGLSFLESGIEDTTEIESKSNRVEWNICLSPDAAAVSSREENIGHYYSKSLEMDYQSTPLAVTFADTFYMKTEIPIIARQPARFEFSSPLYKATADFAGQVDASVIPKYCTDAHTYVTGFDVVFESNTPQKILSPFLIKNFEGKIIRSYFLEKWIEISGAGARSYFIGGSGQWMEFIITANSPSIVADLYLGSERISSLQKIAQNVYKMQFLLEEQKQYEVRINASSDNYQLIIKPLARQ